MKQMLKTYEEALQLTDKQIKELEQQLKKAKSAERIMLIQRKIAIAESQRNDIIKTIYDIEDYLEAVKNK